MAYFKCLHLTKRCFIICDKVQRTLLRPFIRTLLDPEAPQARDARATEPELQEEHLVMRASTLLAAVKWATQYSRHAIH